MEAEGGGRFGVEPIMILPFVVPTSPHARAAMLVEVARAAPGRSFLAAVEISTDPHWHVYWRNPGDSGVPTKIAWQAPKGWRVEPLEWPVPIRFAPGGIAAYGYEGKTLFLARVTPSKTPGTLTAKASWLVCSDACIQGAATVRAKVALASTAVAGASGARLRAAQASLPSPAAGWSLRATTGLKGVTLVAKPPEGTRAKTLEFFPEESGVIDHAKPALATLQGGRYVFKFEASPFPEKRTRLVGLLAFSSGAGREALIVAPKLEREN